MKSLRRLVSSARERREQRLFVLEHPVAIGELIGAKEGPASTIDGEPFTLWVDAEATSHREAVAQAMHHNIEVVTLAPGVLRSVADVASPSGLMLTGPTPRWQLSDLSTGPETLEFILVEVGDPGNAGTIVRAGVAMGATGVVATEGTVDLFGPKALRASAGSIFGIPVVTDQSVVEVLEHQHRRGVATLATVARGGTAPEDLPTEVLSGPLCLLVGNEARGLPDRVTKLCSHEVTIPLLGGIESLNAGVAAAVIGHEVARHRRLSRHA